jgi:DNA topoisomerase-1
VVTKEKKRNPVPPFITSKLQQDAARRLHFTVKKTMMLAQRLYEGIDLGGEEGRIGLITYMRTDSTRVSDDALEMVRSYVSDVYGGPYLPEKPVIYKSKKGAQDAHEAIRPTFVGRRPDDLKAYLSDDEMRLYRLIWTRFVASQMNPAVYDQTTVEISAKDYMFRASGRIMKFDGFLAVYEESSDEDAKPLEPDDEQDITLPPLTQGEKLRLLEMMPRQHFTEPPPRFTEASLVKALEEQGIGRPSTYATILTTIQDREYVTKDQGKFRPTELGTVVTEMLVKHFEDIFDVKYTAHMELELDEVEDGKMTWVEALDDFYKKFEKDLKKASKNMENLKTQEIPTDEVCEKCGSPMVIKWGQFGRFMACSGYPECKNTKEIASDEAPKEGEAPAESAEPDPCENCGKPMALKRGRFGQFLACTGYPECKTTRKIASGGKASKKPDVALDEICPQCGKAKLMLKEGRFGEFISCGNYPNCKYIKPKTVGVACPKPGCGGELIERRSKRGKVFYGCLKYPACDFVVWNKPVPEPCPECGAPFLLEKATKKEGLVRYCNEEACKYKVPIETEKVS